jgi:hypothetical protein
VVGTAMGYSLEDKGCQTSYFNNKPRWIQRHLLRLISLILHHVLATTHENIKQTGNNATNLIFKILKKKKGNIEKKNRRLDGNSVSHGIGVITR